VTDPSSSISSASARLRFEGKPSRWPANTHPSAQLIGRDRHASPGRASGKSSWQFPGSGHSQGRDGRGLWAGNGPDRPWPSRRDAQALLDAGQRPGESVAARGCLDHAEGASLGGLGRAEQVGRARPSGSVFGLWPAVDQTIEDVMDVPHACLPLLSTTWPPLACIRSRRAELAADPAATAGLQRRHLMPLSRSRELFGCFGLPMAWRNGVSIQRRRVRPSPRISSSWNGTLQRGCRSSSGRAMTLQCH